MMMNFSRLFEVTGSPCRPKPRCRRDQPRYSLAAALPLRPTHIDGRSGEKVPKPHSPIGRPRETPLRVVVTKRVSNKSSETVRGELVEPWTAPRPFDRLRVNGRLFRHPLRDFG